MSNNGSSHSAAEELILDSLPDHVEATIESRNAWLRQLGSGIAGLEFIVSDVRRWTPGQAVRVAFKGGDTALHQNIADATQQITDNCNLTLDFGFDAQTGSFRTWSPSDTEYVADIRVAFEHPGYFSLVGTDSVDPTLGAPNQPVGGRPGQCSLNLNGFPAALPPNWRGVTRHEFLHALSFHHAHQNLRGPCEQQFRWEDDPGYVPTQDPRGQFIADASGKRPGIYTFLAGAPNFWSRAKVDHNLRTHNDPDVVIGPFDAQSVMLYRFPEMFYKAVPSSCAPTGDGITLSDGDKRGLQLLYPQVAAAVEAVMERRNTLVGMLEGAFEPVAALEMLPGTQASVYAHGVASALKRTLA